MSEAGYLPNRYSTTKPSQVFINALPIGLAAQTWMKHGPWLTIYVGLSSGYIMVYLFGPIAIQTGSDDTQSFGSFMEF